MWILCNTNCMSPTLFFSFLLSLLTSGDLRYHRPASHWLLTVNIHSIWAWNPGHYRVIHSFLNYRLHCFQAGHPHELADQTCPQDCVGACTDCAWWIVLHLLSKFFFGHLGSVEQVGRHWHVVNFSLRSEKILRVEGAIEEWSCGARSWSATSFTGSWKQKKVFLMIGNMSREAF